ncbi:DUF423 domain-containing protein [Carboxylicivirga mesophila]|uniref:DUF423 domain-containing protein n=1 Tax=Carboxylicivirga mesophila TaxID=1166478 RepID=A0ABS5KBF5_9BACT|nr:DUF423 domain-containing protein [Carboxylicivirga mesophila]MBS2212354.1 DUF423 domain-containing protein [Carboxylicivirga mesophila]
MKQIVLVFGSIYGALSVTLGALGAHALKKVLTESQLQSFEVGVKYQMYHAIVLLVIGFFFTFETRLQQMMGWSFISGTFLFSFSIYFLSLSSLIGASLKVLGPVTPLGGLLMILGWCLLLIQIVRSF